MDLFTILRYTADVSNAWFRGLYAYGVWLPADYVRKLVPFAWGLTESWFVMNLKSVLRKGTAPLPA